MRAGATFNSNTGNLQSGFSGYFPYGEHRYGGGANFATYTRDGDTGLDYAQQRQYGSAHCVFTTADPYVASGGPADPGSWNRYAYVGGDPVNFNDEHGLDQITVGSGPGQFQCVAKEGWTHNIELGSLLTWGLVCGVWSNSQPRPAMPVPMDPLPRVTREQALGFWNLLRDQVHSMQESDCNALADYIDAVNYPDGNNSGAQDDIVRALGWVTPGPNHIPLVYDTPGAKLLNAFKAPSGFLSQYQDQEVNADQAHHFAAFFQIGYRYGPGLGSLGANAYESIEGTSSNSGDIMLGTIVASLGWQLRSGKVLPSELGSLVRLQLCDPTWNP